MNVPGNEDPWWLSKATKELGTKEIKGIKHNPKILEYHSWTTLNSAEDETPWCAAFLRWVFCRKGGANARSFLQFGKPLPEFKRGCIVVLSRDEAGLGAGHVALGIREWFDADKNDTFIECLGGNQGDRVSIAKFSKKRLLSYRWPPGELIDGIKEGV